MKLSLVLGLLWLASPLAAQETLEDRIRLLRDSKGLSVPRLSGEFAAASENRAGELLRIGALSHADARGRGPALQMTALGFAAGEYGEILGAGNELDGVWMAWINSPAHYAVLVSPGWTRWGWGRAVGKGTSVWVVRFWKP